MESEEFLESLGPDPQRVFESKKPGIWKVEQIGYDIDKWEASYMGKALPVYFKSKERALTALLELATSIKTA